MRSKKKDEESAGPGYSLYSTDSEDPVTMAHKGLDRCATLLANIMDGPQGTGEGKNVHRKGAVFVKRAKTKKKKKPTSPTTTTRGKTRRKTVPPKRAGTRDDLHPKFRQREAVRTTYHPELKSSTPQGKAGTGMGHTVGRGAEPRLTRESVNPITKSKVAAHQYLPASRGSTTVSDAHRDVEQINQEQQYQSHLRTTSGYRGGEMLPAHGPYFDQMIPERENDHRVDNQVNTGGLPQEAEVVHESGGQFPVRPAEFGPPVGQRVNFDYSAVIPEARTNKLGGSCIGPGNPNLGAHHLQQNGVHPPYLHSSGVTDSAGSLNQLPWHHTMPPSVDRDTAKHVLRDLVNTLKYMNEKDAAAMDAKLLCHAGNECRDANIASRLADGNVASNVTSDPVTTVNETKYSTSANRVNTNDRLVQVDNLPEAQCPTTSSLLSRLKTVESNHPPGKFGVNSDDRSGNTQVASDTIQNGFPAAKHVEFKNEFQQVNEQENRNQLCSGVVSSKQTDTADGQIGLKGTILAGKEEVPCSQVGKAAQQLVRSPPAVVLSGKVENENQNGEQNSPARRRKKKGLRDKSSGRGRNEKRPLWDQQRVLKYLVMELKTASVGPRGDLEVERLFSEILHTLDELPALTMDRDTQTEIAMALQPLRSENAALRRKLRIANLQAKEAHRQADAKLGDCRPNSEVIELQALNATLQGQLEANQKESGALRDKVQTLKMEVGAYATKSADMEKALSLKDECHLRSQGEWMAEMASLRRELTGSRNETEALRWKLDSVKKENDFLMKNLEESKESLRRGEETNLRLENLLSRLAPRQEEGHDPNLMTGHGSFSRSPEHPLSTKSKKRTSPKRKRDWDITDTEGTSDNMGKTGRPSLASQSQHCVDTHDTNYSASGSTIPKVQCKPHGPGLHDTGEGQTPRKEEMASSVLKRSLLGLQKNLLVPTTSPRVEPKPSRLAQSQDISMAKDLQKPSAGGARHSREKSQGIQSISTQATLWDGISVPGFTTGGPSFTSPGQDGRAVHRSQRDSLSSTLPSRGTEDWAWAKTGIQDPDLSGLNRSLQGAGILAIGAERGPDTVSHASDSTASTITSLFEAQFQLGLSNLDEKIAELQSNLRSMKK